MTTPIHPDDYAKLPTTDRNDTFTDAVLAIIITLMAIEITPPSAEAVAQLGLAGALLEEWPAFLAFTISFLLIGQVWLNHHIMWRWIARADYALLALQLFHLMFTSLIPLASRLLAEHMTGGLENRQTGAVVYAGVALLVSLSYMAVWWWAQYRGLVKIEVSVRRSITRRYASISALYALALIFAFVSVPVSLGLYFLLIFNFLLPGKV